MANIVQTEFMLFGSSQRLRLQNNQQIKIEGRKISQVESATSLGVYIDDKLTWEKHEDEISKKIKKT